MPYLSTPSVFRVLLCTWFGGSGGHLAAQRRQSRHQLFLAARLAGPEVYPQGPVVSRAAGLRGAAEDVLAPGDLEPDETGGHDRDLELCLQQSPGYSPGPEVYLAFGALGNGLLYQDVPDLQTAAGFRYPTHLLKRSILIRHQVEHTVGDEHVRPAFVYR